MQLSEKETQTLVDRLRALNVVTWELVGLVPAKGNAALINVLETIVNETDVLVARYDREAGE